MLLTFDFKRFTSFLISVSGMGGELSWATSSTRLLENLYELKKDGWVDELRFKVFFNYISVIS